MRKRPLVWQSVFLIALMLLAACEEGGSGEKPNEPPRVWLSVAPPEGSVSSYRVDVEWGGWDPDGKVTRYEYAITNNDGIFDPADTTGADKWTRTTKTGGVFVFSADELVDSTTTEQASEFRRSHTFFVRAIDNRGTPSLKPAYRSFTARTLSPVVTIVSPNPVSYPRMPVIGTYRWTVRDYVDDFSTVQAPEAVSVLFEGVDDHGGSFAETVEHVKGLPLDSPAWVWISFEAEPGDELTMSWTSPPIDPGSYVMAVRARDEAGAATPVLDEAHNLVPLLVGGVDTGPILSFYNEWLGTLATAVCRTPVTITAMLAGVPFGGCFEADASPYGGQVAAYRYGWDVANPGDPKAWEVDWTPYTGKVCIPERTMYFATHTLSIQVEDNSGFFSCLEIKVNVVQLTMTRSVLVVDDFNESPLDAGWDNPRGRGVLPNDEEHDAFWLDVTSDVAGFEPDVDVIEVGGGDVIPLTLIGNYKAIIWSVLAHVDAPVDDRPLLYDLIKFEPKDGGEVFPGGFRTPNLLKMYMAAGGHVMIAGQHPVSMAVNPIFAWGLRYPIIFQYELEGDQDGRPDIGDPPGDESFAYKDLCVDVMDFAVTGYSRWRTEGLNCPVTNLRHVIPTGKRDHGMRAGIPIDPGFPRIELRPETAATGKAHQPSEAGLDVEVYNPQYFFDACQFTPSFPRDCFQPIYGLECLDTAEPTFGQPVAFWTSYYADRLADAPGTVEARSVVFGFPPVMFEPAAVKPAIETILFDEWRLPRR